MKNVLRRLVMVAVVVGSVVTSAAAQGRCQTTYGAPACNTAEIPPIFAPTGWHTMALDQVTFQVAEYKKEAAFYAALMGWKLRSDDGRQAVMDVGEWGTVIFKTAGPGVLEAASSGGGRGGPSRAVITSFGFAIDKWDAKTVDAELKKRGLSPVADNDGKGFESF
ncbi:MAG: hypothetical protein ABI665_26130, partial [Vicinamibacterales bacterium]